MSLGMLCNITVNSIGVLQIFITLVFFFSSFQQGDVFVVDNVIDSDWLWVTAQKNQEKGVVPAALVEDAVCIVTLMLSYFI